MSALEKKQPAKKKTSRYYKDSTLKILFATSMNRCAMPGCHQSIVEKSTKKSSDAVIGEIAHIYAFSEDGPRGRGDLNDQQINEPDNLILLCPTHHTVVDAQHESYPANILMEWKREQELRFKDCLGATISDLGYSELETAAKALMASTASPQSYEFRIITPEKKIEKNSLGSQSRLLITMGASSSHLVEDMLLKAIQLNPQFADMLKEGFNVKYKNFADAGLVGDDLFNALHEWAAGSSGNQVRRASGLCILVHLFIICDIFER